MNLEILVGNVDREFCIVKALDGADRRPSGLNDERAQHKFHQIPAHPAPSSDVVYTKIILMNPL